MTDERETDQALLHAWREGDREAGSRLFQRHFRTVHRFFVNKLSGDVDDLLQRTFLACTSAKDRFQGRSSVRTYLLAIANNVLLEEYRRRAGKRGVDFDVESAEALAPGPSTQLRAKREYRVLLEALRRLPVKYQIVLELYYWEGLSAPAIGDVLGLSPNTVHGRIRLARPILRRELRRLNASTAVLESTDEDLDKWANGVRDLLSDVAS